MIVEDLKNARPDLFACSSFVDVESLTLYFDEGRTVEITGDMMPLGEEFFAKFAAIEKVNVSRDNFSSFIMKCDDLFGDELPILKRNCLANGFKLIINTFRNYHSIESVTIIINPENGKVFRDRDIGVFKLNVPKSNFSVFLNFVMNLGLKYQMRCALLEKGCKELFDFFLKNPLASEYELSFRIDENSFLQIDDDFIIWYGLKQRKILDTLNEGKTVLLYKNLINTKKDIGNADVELAQKVNGLAFPTASEAFVWEEENKFLTNV
jgi:hypothetical protein